jgi:hypothetical protein
MQFALLHPQEAIQQTVLSYPSIVQQLEEALHRSMNTVKGVRSFTEIYLAKVRLNLRTVFVLVGATAACNGVYFL